MRLVELLVASTVLAVASTSSLQLAATSANLHRGTLRGEQQLDRIERDRLWLQGRWRQAAPANSPCGSVARALQQASAALPQPEELRRTLSLSGDGEALLVHWQRPDQPESARTRLLSPAALGLCSPAAEAITSPLPPGDTP